MDVTGKVHEKVSEVINTNLLHKEIPSTFLKIALPNQRKFQFRGQDSSEQGSMNSQIPGFKAPHLVSLHFQWACSLLSILVALHLECLLLSLPLNT